MPPPSTSQRLLTHDESGNVYPLLVNGLPLNLPAGTTLGGSPFRTAAYVNTGTTSGTVPLLGTGGHLASATMPLGAQLYDNTPVLSVDVLGRRLMGSDGESKIEWSVTDSIGFFTDALIIGSDGSLSASSVVANGSGLTALNIASANVTGRIGSANLPLGAQLYDNAGTPTLAIDVANRELRNSGGFEVFDFEGSYWYDPSGLAFIDSGNRYFYGPDGTTIDMTLGASEVTFFGGNFTVHANGDMDGSNANVNLWDGSNPTVNSSSRQLIANDGTTVALDWSDPTAISFFDSNFQLQADGFVAFVVASLGNGGTSQRFGFATTWRPQDSNDKISSLDSNTYFDNSGFHGVGSVIAGTKTATGTATTTFTVTIGVTMANTTYKVTTEGDNALSSAVHYVNNKTTTTFDIVYLAGLSGPVSIDWIVSP